MFFIRITSCKTFKQLRGKEEKKLVCFELVVKSTKDNQKKTFSFFPLSVKIIVTANTSRIINFVIP